MFKLEPNPTFPATVHISAPGGENLPLKLVFKHKKSTELDAFMGNSRGRTNDELLDEMVHSVDPTEKAEGQSDADFLAALLESYPASASDLLRSYLREHTESRVKN